MPSTGAPSAGPAAGPAAAKPEDASDASRRSEREPRRTATLLGLDVGPIPFLQLQNAQFSWAVDVMDEDSELLQDKGPSIEAALNGYVQKLFAVFGGPAGFNSLEIRIREGSVHIDAKGNNMKLWLRKEEQSDMSVAFNPMLILQPTSGGGAFVFRRPAAGGGASGGQTLVVCAGYSEEDSLRAVERAVAAVCLVAGVAANPIDCTERLWALDVARFCVLQSGLAGGEMRRLHAAVDEALTRLEEERRRGLRSGGAPAEAELLVEVMRGPSRRLGVTYEQVIRSLADYLLQRYGGPALRRTLVAFASPQVAKVGRPAETAFRRRERFRVATERVSSVQEAAVAWRAWMREAAAPRRALLSVVLRSLKYMRRHPLALALMIAGLVLELVLELSLPVVMKVVITQIEGGDRQGMFYSALFVGAAVLLAWIGAFTYYRNLAFLCAACVKQLQVEMFEHMLRLPDAFLRAYSADEVSTHFSTDLRAFGDSVQRSCEALRNVLQLVLFTALFFKLEPRVALAVCVLQLVNVNAPLAFKSKALDANSRRLTAAVDAAAFARESFEGFRVVRDFGVESTCARKFRVAAMEVGDEVEEQNFNAGMYLEAFGILNQTVSFAVLIGGGVLVLHGRVLLADLIGLVSCAISLGSALKDTIRVVPDLVQGLGGIERIDRLLDETPLKPAEECAAGARKAAPEEAQDIVLRGVSIEGPAAAAGQLLLAAGRAGEAGLRDVSLRIPARSWTCLVGPPLSGKRILAALLTADPSIPFPLPSHARFLYGQAAAPLPPPALAAPAGGRGRPAEAGKEQLVPVASYTREAWKRHVCVVSQEAHIFKATVADNISLFCPFSSQQIADALHDATELLGAASGVGDASRGRGKRAELDLRDVLERKHTNAPTRLTIALARALVRKARVMVFEDVELSGDAGAALMPALTARGITVLQVAHRCEAYMRRADQIVVLDAGRVVVADTPWRVREKLREASAAQEARRRGLEALQRRGRGGRRSSGLPQEEGQESRGHSSEPASGPRSSSAAGEEDAAEDGSGTGDDESEEEDAGEDSTGSSGAPGELEPGAPLGGRISSTVLRVTHPFIRAGSLAPAVQSPPAQPRPELPAPPPPLAHPLAEGEPPKPEGGDEGEAGASDAAGAGSQPKLRRTFARGSRRTTSPGALPVLSVADADADAEGRPPPAAPAGSPTGRGPTQPQAAASTRSRSHSPQGRAPLSSPRAVGGRGELMRLLGGVAAFRGITPAALARAAALFREERFSALEEIRRQAVDAGELVIVAEGSVRQHEVVAGSRLPHIAAEPLRGGDSYNDRVLLPHAGHASPAEASTYQHTLVAEQATRVYTAPLGALRDLLARHRARQAASPERPPGLPHSATAAAGRGPAGASMALWQRHVEGLLEEGEAAGPVAGSPTPPTLSLPHPRARSRSRSRSRAHEPASPGAEAGPSTGGGLRVEAGSRPRASSFAFQPARHSEPGPAASGAGGAAPDHALAALASAVQERRGLQEPAGTTSPPSSPPSSSSPPAMQS